MEQTFVKFLGAFEGNLKLEVAQERRRIFANGHIIDVYFSHSFTMKRHINSLFTFLKSEMQKNYQNSTKYVMIFTITTLS